MVSMPSKPKQTSAEPSSWVQIAERARQKMDAVSHGKREQELLGLKLGVAVNTVRRALAAFEKAPALAKLGGVSTNVIFAFPLTAVEALARWAEYDPKQAAKEITAVREGKTSRKVVADEIERRLKSQDRVWGNSLKAASRQYVKGMLKQQYPNLKRESRGRRNDAIDAQYDGQHGPVALLVYGPYQQSNNHRVSEYTQRILGLATFHHLVVAAVPDDHVSAIKDCLSIFVNGPPGLSDWASSKIQLLQFNVKEAVRAFEPKALTIDETESR